MKQQISQSKKWKPVDIKIEWTKEELTAGAGIAPLVDLFVQTPHYEQVIQNLPIRKSNAGYKSEQFLLTLMSGFLYGHDCLEDLEEFENDPGIANKLGESPSPRAFGDWLRDFSDKNRSDLNRFLHTQAMSYRKQIMQKHESLIIDMDSTSHVQSGEKMEGLAWNYKQEWCLDSLVSYDQHGFCHGMTLRAGNTFSSQGAKDLIEHSFSGLLHGEEKYFRADSAFCNQEVIDTCLRVGARFTITAHDNINWSHHASEIMNWKSWTYSEQEIEEAKKKKKSLPEVELGSFVYQPSWSENLRFYVVVKRTAATAKEAPLFAGQSQEKLWKYYAVLTNWSTYHNSLQSIMEHHQNRGQSENFIREEKYGFDLKHFPCQKLSANHAYGLIALMTHNFLRVLALLDNPDKPHYSKKLRRKFVFLPGRIINHARQLILRIPIRYQKEVDRLLSAWAATRKPLQALPYG
jgi:hypothetical protein